MQTLFANLGLTQRRTYELLPTSTSPPPSFSSPPKLPHPHPTPWPRRYSRLLLALLVSALVWVAFVAPSLSPSLSSASFRSSSSTPSSDDDTSRLSPANLARLPPSERYRAELSAYPPYPAALQSAPDDWPREHDRPKPPLFGAWVEWEKGMPQHRLSIPSASSSSQEDDPSSPLSEKHSGTRDPEDQDQDDTENGSQPKYLFIASHQRGAGWGNYLQEMVLNAHLAYVSGRGYVFDNYTWERDGPEYSTFKDKLIPARIPLSVLVSGPITGYPHLSPSPPPRSISRTHFHAICPPEERLIIDSGSVQRSVVDYLAQHGETREPTAVDMIDGWVRKLGEEDVRGRRCVEVERDGAQIFDIWILGSPRVHSAYHALASSPVLREFAWSPLVMEMFRKNRGVFLRESNSTSDPALDAAVVPKKQSVGSDGGLLRALFSLFFPVSPPPPSSVSASVSVSGTSTDVEQAPAPPRPTLPFPSPPPQRFSYNSYRYSYSVSAAQQAKNQNQTRLALDRASEEDLKRDARVGFRNTRAATALERTKATDTATNEDEESSTHLPLIALHIRRGDFEGHCTHLAAWGSTYTGFNTLPGLPDRFESPMRPPSSDMDEGEGSKEMQMQRAYDAAYSRHCWPTTAQIVRRVREAVNDWAELQARKERVRWRVHERGSASSIVGSSSLPLSNEEENSDGARMPPTPNERRTTTTAEQVRQRLRRVYIMTNGDPEWAEEVRRALVEDAARSARGRPRRRACEGELANSTSSSSAPLPLRVEQNEARAVDWKRDPASDWKRSPPSSEDEEGEDWHLEWTWDSIASSRDIQLGWEEKPVGQALDMYIGQRAEVFIGNGFSSLTANIVLLRLASGMDPKNTRFW